MAFYDRFIEGTLQRLGYTKANYQPASVLWAGEAPIAPDLNFASYDSMQMERLAITSSWVYSDIREIANLATSSKFEVFRKTDEDLEAITDHECERLVANPNPFMSGAWALQYTIWWLLLRGEAYWWKVFDRSGRLIQLWPIPSSRMQPIPDKDKYIRGYAYTAESGGVPITLSPEQVAFFRLVNVTDYHRGMSPLSAYRLALETDTAAARWNKDTFLKEVSLKMLISLPAELSSPIFTQRQAEIRTELIDNRSRFMIARAGDVKATPLSMTPRDLDFLAGRAFTRDEIDRTFGFPGGYWSVQANRANAEAAKAAVMDGAVWPILTLIHDGITSQIVRPHYGEDLVGQFEDIRPRDRALQIAERRQYWQVKTLDEARADLGDSPYVGPMSEAIAGLLLPLATNPQFVMALAGITPISVPPGQSPPERGSPGGKSPESEQEVMGGEEGEMQETPAEETMPPVAPGEEKALKDDLRKWEGIARRRLKNGESPSYDFESAVIPLSLKLAILEALPEAQTDEAIKAVFTNPFYRLTGPDWPVLQTALGLCHTETAMRHVLTHPGEYTVKAVLALPGEGIPDYQAELEDSFQTAIRPYLAAQAKRVAQATHNGELPGRDFWAQEDRLLAAFLIPFAERWVGEGIGASVGLLDQVGLGVGESVNARAAAWAGKHALELAKGLNGTTRDLAKAKITNWLAQPGGLVQDLEVQLEEFIAPDWRASLIAQTEVAYALSAATQEVGQEMAGIVKGYVYQTVNDERVCPVCFPLNGQNRPLDGVYSDGEGAPPRHCRCRCRESFWI